MSARRQLGLWSATALVVATMVGTGVFTTSGFLLADLQSRGAVLAVWVVGGIISALGAVCYGALSRRYPESGGEYLFLSHTIHPAAGYVAGWVSLVVGFAAPTAASAFAFGKYVSAWFPAWEPQFTGSLLIVIFSAIHAAHVQRGAWTQNFGVLLNLLLILGFITIASLRLQGHSAIAPGNVVPVKNFATVFAVSLIWVSYAYAGWNAASYIGGEIRNPERTLPRALLLGTVLVTLLYFALNAVFVYSAPVAALAGKVEIGREAALHLGGNTWAEAVTVMVALVLMMSVSSFVMAGPRICSQMAADGYLPRWLSPETGPPRHAIYLQGILALAMLATATFDGLLTYVGLTLSLMTAAAVGGLIAQRLREREKLPIPGWPWVPWLFLITVLWTCGVTIVQKPMEAAAGFGTMLIGWAIWRWQRR